MSRSATSDSRSGRIESETWLAVDRIDEAQKRFGHCAGRSPAGLSPADVGVWRSETVTESDDSRPLRSPGPHSLGFR
jgi:hypothetical protein